LSKLILDSTGTNDTQYNIWFNSDGTKAFTINSHIGRVIDLESGNNEKVFDFHKLRVLDVIKRFDYNTGDDRINVHFTSNTFLNDFKDGFRPTGHYQDGDNVYIAGMKNIYKFSFSDNSFTHHLNFGGYINWDMVIFSAFNENHDKMVLSGGHRYESRVAFIDLSEEVSINSFSNQDGYLLEPISLSPDANYFLGAFKNERGNKQRTIMIYDSSTASNTDDYINRFQEHESEVVFVNFVNNGTAISGDIDGTIIKWDIETLEVLDKYNMHWNNGAWDFKYFDYEKIDHVITDETLRGSGYGLIFEFANSPLKEGTVTVYDDGTDVTGSVTIDYTNGTATFDSAATTPVKADYTWIETGEPRKAISSGERVKVYNVDNKHIFADFKIIGHTQGVSISPNQNLVAGVSNHGEVKIYDLDLTVVTNSATEVKYNSMTLNGQLYTMRGYSSIDCYFEVSPDPNFNVDVTTSTAVTKTEPGEFSVTVYGLYGDQKYYYRAFATPSA
jgi:hypothetical protein